VTSSAPNLSQNQAANLTSVLERIAAARVKAVAPAPDTKLVAIAKTHGAEDIIPVLEAGQRVFGENRVQEARAKWPLLRQRFPDIELHLVGPLQTNKARDALELFDVIETLDRLRLAESLKAEIDKRGAGRLKQLFVEVNSGEEPQKAGVTPKDVVGFVAQCRDALKLPVVGLMCIPPVDEEAALHFALLKKLAAECGLASLSMGMSADFETAIRFGATHVRVGTAIFGERTAKP
jgi:pyridoxal phosphate enzyme (YggS family)